jgi:hypothetical protein
MMPRYKENIAMIISNQTLREWLSWTHAKDATKTG